MSLKVGDICYFDPFNLIKTRENGTDLVKIGGINRHLFKQDEYVCLSLNTGDTIICNKNVLLKVTDEDQKDHQVLIRISEDAPYITDTDIKTVNDCLVLLGSFDSDIRQRLTMLESKLEFYSQVRDI